MTFLGLIKGPVTLHKRKCRYYCYFPLALPSSHSLLSIFTHTFVWVTLARCATLKVVHANYDALSFTQKIP